ncbi:MAG: hypothetical protein ACOC8D_02820 [bacterium]
MATQECMRCGGAFEKGLPRCSWCDFPAPARRRIRPARLLAIVGIVAAVGCAPLALAIGWSLHQQGNLAGAEPQSVPPDAPSATAPATPAASPADPASPETPPEETTPPAEDSPGGVQPTEVSTHWLPDNLADPDGTAWKRLTPLGEESTAP